MWGVQLQVLEGSKGDVLSGAQLLIDLRDEDDDPTDDTIEEIKGRIHQVNDTQANSIRTVKTVWQARYLVNEVKLKHNKVCD